MYFWRTKNLVAELRNDTLSPENIKNYYLATLILTSIGYFIGRFHAPENISAYATEVIGTIGSTIFGLNYALKSNGGNTGRNFLDRAVSISFPLLIKSMVAALLLGFMLGLLEIRGFEKSVFEWLKSASLILIQIVFYWRLGLHIRRVNV